MPDPNLPTSLPSWREVGELFALIAAGAAGWVGKHIKVKQDGVSPGDMKRIGEIHRALLVEDGDLRMTLVEQVKMVARFVSEPDADGNRVSLFRKVLNSMAISFEQIAANSSQQTALMKQQAEMLEKRLDVLDETWGGGRVPARRKGEAE